MHISSRIIAALSLTSFGALAAGVPAQLEYQGRLLKADGSPVTETVAVTFNLYPSATSTSLLWTETLSVTPTDGFFEVMLGDPADSDPTSPPLASFFDGRQLSLGIKVGSDPEMSPRAPIVSAPYALLATPVAHGQTHMKGGGDEIATVAPSADQIPMAGPLGLLDPGWMPIIPPAKGGTGTATPTIVRNLCVYVAGPVSASAPTVPLPPDLKSCSVVQAFASASIAPAAPVSWNFTETTTSASLFPAVNWAAGTRSDASVPAAVPLPPSAVISPAAVGPATFQNATFCLQVRCEVSFQ